RFSPLNNASPLVRVLAPVVSPMIVRHVTLFPEPDSPTMPRIPPFRTEKETPSTAFTTPSSVLKCVLRSRTSSRLIPVARPFASILCRGHSRRRRRLNRGGRAGPLIWHLDERTHRPSP